MQRLQPNDQLFKSCRAATLQMTEAEGEIKAVIAPVKSETRANTCRGYIEHARKGCARAPGTGPFVSLSEQIAGGRWKKDIIKNEPQSYRASVRICSQAKATELMTLIMQQCQTSEGATVTRRCLQLAWCRVMVMSPIIIIATPTYPRSRLGDWTLMQRNFANMDREERERQRILSILQESDSEHESFTSETEEEEDHLSVRSQDSDTDQDASDNNSDEDTLCKKKMSRLFCQKR
ncbi:hypothetical protein ACJJTC_003252 [Scirpophaga incertulas]